MKQNGNHTDLDSRTYMKCWQFGSTSHIERRDDGLHCAHCGIHLLALHP